MQDSQTALQNLTAERDQLIAQLRDTETQIGFSERQIREYKAENVGYEVFLTHNAALEELQAKRDRQFAEIDQLNNAIAQVQTAIDTEIAIEQSMNDTPGLCCTVVFT